MTVIPPTPESTAGSPLLRVPLSLKSSNAVPVIVAADADSETAQVVSEAECGVVVPPGRPEELATAVRAAYDGDLDLEAMGARGRDYVVAEADLLVAVERYRVVLESLLSERRASA